MAGLSRKGMEECVRRYFDGCNLADSELIQTCLNPEAVHYFPPGMYGGPWVGAETIGRKWQEAVAALGSYWNIDRIACDVTTAQAVGEWTHFKTKQDAILRGDEWYSFDRRSGLITEIRAYYASPQDASLTRLELHGFDYVRAGYAEAPPVARYPRLGLDGSSAG